MRSGVAYPALAPSFTLAAGTPDANYPVANLADLVRIRKVFKATGAVQISFTLATAQSVGLVALVHHNAAAGATWHVVLKNGVTTVADSGVVNLNARSIYPAVDPWCPTSPVTADNGTITLSSASWSIGAVQVAGFWSFKDVQANRELGLHAKDTVQEAADGADETVKLFSPRTYLAKRLIDVTQEADTALDFAQEKGTDTPFVWVWDADDATTFERQAILVRNTDLKLLTKDMHPSGRVTFALEEHLR